MSQTESARPGIAAETGAEQIGEIVTSVLGLEEVLDAVRRHGLALAYDPEVEVWTSTCPLCAAAGESGSMGIYARTADPVAVMMCCDRVGDEHRAYEIAKALGVRPWFMGAVEQGRADLARVIRVLTERGVKMTNARWPLGGKNFEPCPVCPAGNDSAVLVYTDEDSQPDAEGHGSLRMGCDGEHEEEVILAALGIVTRAILRANGAAVWVDDPTDDEPDWLDDPLIERGQFTSIYGPAGIGKSLLAQDRSARLASQGYRVLYLDQENQTREVRRRLRDMGHTPADLEPLTYISFPELPPIDTPSGATRLAAIVEAVNPDLVVLDTWSKFLAGDEAAPTTHTTAYNLSIVPLRQRGIAVLAIDHSGKDPGRGPRGGSSKVDNVDALWLLTSKGNRHFRLEKRKSRTGRGPDLVEMVRDTVPVLRHRLIDLAEDGVLAPEVRECVELLDELEAPSSLSVRGSAEMLRAAGHKISNQSISAAVKMRKARGGPAVFPEHSGTDLTDEIITTVPGTSEQ